MAILNLLDWDNPLFDKKSREITSFDARLHTLLDDMLETIRQANGYGCAAVHFGVLRRAVVIDDRYGVLELVNPVITDMSLQTKTDYEASIAPGSPSCRVNRPQKITVCGSNRNGEPININASGFLAAALCHEIDHLDGIRYTEKAEY
ncbi:MAG: peptide deformylase [Ruminococcaceae bacterium]|nr:peptide deformylase [Oscillospiraceae bacterium]